MSAAASIAIDHTGLEMGSERFERLLRSFSAGLLQQIPIMGPVIQAILADQSQADFEARLRKLIEELSQSKSPREQSPPNLVPALLLAEAEVEHRLTQDANPKKRFLYLAGKKYASVERTYEIAVQYGFLWRKYYNTRGAAIANVGGIRNGDVIALGYRVPSNQFRVMLPLVVTESSPPYTQKINWTSVGKTNSGPFVTVHQNRCRRVL